MSYLPYVASRKKNGEAKGFNCTDCVCPDHAPGVDYYYYHKKVKGEYVHQKRDGTIPQRLVALRHKASNNFNSIAVLNGEIVFIDDVSDPEPIIEVKAPTLVQTPEPMIEVKTSEPVPESEVKIPITNENLYSIYDGLFALNLESDDDYKKLMAIKKILGVEFPKTKEPEPEPKLSIVQEPRAGVLFPHAFPEISSHFQGPISFMIDLNLNN